MRTFLRVALVVPAIALGMSSAPAAAPQDPSGVIPVSLERIRKQLDRPAGPFQILLLRPKPMVTFKSHVEQRVFVPTLQEVLHKEFDLNDLQRQSAAWAAQCCGISIGQVTEMVGKALRERKIRKTREQIARELAALEAARKK